MYLYSNIKLIIYLRCDIMKKILSRLKKRKEITLHYTYTNSYFISVNKVWTLKL